MPDFDWTMHILAKCVRMEAKFVNDQQSLLTAINTSE